MMKWDTKTLNRRAAEQSGVGSALRVEKTTGMVQGTKVATRYGWCAIENISVGDLVLTFDGGLRPVTAIYTKKLSATQTQMPLHLVPYEVPAGALGNREDMWLLPEQSVMIESDAAEEFLGDAFALIPVHSLKGYRGIGPKALREELDLFILEFEEDEIVFANSGVLFHCPKRRDIVAEMLNKADPKYDLLDDEIAYSLVELLDIEDEGYSYHATRARPVQAVA